MISVKFDHGAVRAFVDGVSEKLDKAIWPAAAAGAKVFYDQVKVNVKTNVMSSTAGHWFHGTSYRLNGKKYWIEPATLDKHIYTAYSQDRSNDQKKVYHVSWNYKEVPYGFMVEFGHRARTSKGKPAKHVPAHPFLNPAWSRRGDALDAARKTLMEQMK